MSPSKLNIEEFIVLKHLFMMLSYNKFRMSLRESTHFLNFLEKFCKVFQECQKSGKKEIRKQECEYVK